MKPRLFMIALATASLLTACNNDNETDNRPTTSDTPWIGEIRLCSGVTVQQIRATGATPDTQIPAGEEVKVVVAKQDADTDASYAGYTQTFTATGNGSFSEMSTMFYPASGKGVSIYAYHPADAGTSFNVVENQSTDPSYFASDLLYSAKKDYARQSDAHSLAFNHKLSKLTYALESGAGSPDITGAAVKWTNVCKTIAFTKETGTLGAASNPTEITPNATYGTILVPQTVAGGTKLLTVTLTNGKVFSYVPKDGQVFSSGQVCNYKIKVNLSSLTVTSSINNWTPITDRTGDAEME